ncbi:competence protein ComJ [Enterobacter ludwigii]|uniref:competence protein ComJ n=1 Tax=Enterobacter ludwigii TaxID=299767 RepID=UPI001054AAA6|nr:competence protein ComJ [Enterobacter ludwigii]
MNDKKIQIVDLLISHSQIVLRSRDYDEKLSQWGKGNVSQGAVLHKDYVIFDPLPEDAFGANVNIKIENAFKLDENAQRCIVVPFFITDKHKLQIASATEKFYLNLELHDELYSLFYEVCEGDEIYYNFTLVPTKEAIAAKFLLDNPWGGLRNILSKMVFFKVNSN